MRTLRFYEQRGLLKPHRVGATRIYSTRDRIVMDLITTGKRLRFSLGEIERIIGVSWDRIEAGNTAAADYLSKSEIIEKIAYCERRRDAVAEAIANLKIALAGKP